MSTVPQRRRFRFRVGTLLIALTVAVVLAWTYWAAWPRWTMARDQSLLEQSVKQLKRGDAFGDAVRLTGQNYEVALLSGTRDKQGREYGWIRFEWPNAVYLVLGPLEPSSDGLLDSQRFSAVEVYRLPEAPQDYSPQTDRGCMAVEESRRPDGLKDSASDIAYWSDFLEMLLNDRGRDLGFKYELIHSDPPKSEPK